MEEMRLLWASKITHEGRKVREQLEDDKIHLEEAAEKLTDEKDWQSILRVDQVGARVEERAKDMMDTMESFQKKLGI